MKTRAAVIVLSLAGLSRADVAYDNFGPGSTFSGNGWLVMGPQAGIWSHAFPVTPTVSGEITTITVAIAHLGGSTNNYTFQLRADAGGTPGPTIATLGSVAGLTPGDPVPVSFSAGPGTSITAGTTYWVYASGQNDGFGTWLTSPNNGGVRAYSFNGGSSFTVEPLGSTNAQGAIRIEVTPAGGSCYANCDHSTGTPRLTGNDFVCFINAYAGGQSYANCDGSTGTPQLTGNDFVCFINQYATGCR